MTDAVAYVMQRIGELTEMFIRLDQKIDDTMGDHSVRIAKLELRADQSEQRIDAATTGRRWQVTTWIAALSLLVALAAVLVAVKAATGGT
jgi:hypothetical protein